MDIKSIIKDAEVNILPYFQAISNTAYANQIKILNAFRKFNVSERHFYSSSGYGYNDIGRDTLDTVYAEVFDSEAAFARHNIVSGTHAITIGLFGLLRPGDIILSVTGKPYDTLDSVIGINRTQTNYGSLRDFGVEYLQTNLIKDKTDINIFDLEKISSYLTSYPNIKVVFVQRSKGYESRPTLSSKLIGELNSYVKNFRPDVYLVVDNCYGEFTETHEPTYYGADMIIGSLIKNPGGGMCESGGYIAGNKKAVELAAYRLTSPEIGLEVGASLSQTKNMYKGLFYAPHTVAEALKTAVYAAYIYERLGYEVAPLYNDPRYDIIQAINFGSSDKLCAFCKGIQRGAPVDSFLTPEPWDMPGYDDPVIMAAGAFVQGASIELSADGPLRPPYTAFLQGGLTFESGKYGVICSVEEITGEGNALF